MFRIAYVIGRADDGVAVVAASGVEAGLSAAADVGRDAFIDVLTGSFVRRETVTFGALARVAPRFVDAETDAETSALFVLFAFVDVHAGSVIG